MKRDIRFRGKRIDNGEWVYGNLVTYFNKPAIQDYAQTNGEIFLVDPETVGQYTGLSDRNGKEIYEGDIIPIHNQNNVVEYDRGSFVVKGLHEDKNERTYAHLIRYLIDVTIPDMDGSEYDGVTTSLEVIGNRWSNPDLLEGEKI